MVIVVAHGCTVTAGGTPSDHGFRAVCLRLWSSGGGAVSGALRTTSLVDCFKARRIMRIPARCSGRSRESLRTTSLCAVLPIGADGLAGRYQLLKGGRLRHRPGDATAGSALTVSLGRGAGARRGGRARPPLAGASHLRSVTAGTARACGERGSSTWRRRRAPQGSRPKGRDRPPPPRRTGGGRCSAWSWRLCPSQSRIPTR